MHSIVTTFRGAGIKVEVANFCAAMDTLIDQDGTDHVAYIIGLCVKSKSRPKVLLRKDQTSESNENHKAEHAFYFIFHLGSCWNRHRESGPKVFFYKDVTKPVTF